MSQRLYKISRLGLWVGLLIALVYFVSPLYMFVAYADTKVSMLLAPILYPEGHDWVIMAQGTNRLVGVTFGFYLAFLSAFGMYASRPKDNPQA